MTTKETTYRVGDTIPRPICDLYILSRLTSNLKGTEYAHSYLPRSKGDPWTWTDKPNEAGIFSRDDAQQFLEDFAHSEGTRATNANHYATTTG